MPSSMPTGSPPEPDDSRYRSEHVPQFANEEEAERWKRSMLDELRELHRGGLLQPASTPEETPPRGEPFRALYQKLVPSEQPTGRPRLRLVYAKGYEPGQVGPRSKTGDADCSAATSAWKTGRATPETHQQLAKCRAMTKTAKQATLQRAAGNEAKAQALEHRVASKGPLTAKARKEEATKRVQERAGRNQARAERQASASEQAEQARVAAAGEPPPENHEEQARQAAVKAIRAHRASPSRESRAAAETAFAHYQEVSGGKDPFAPDRVPDLPGSKPGKVGYEPDAFERDQMEHAARQAAARAQQPRTIQLRRPSPEQRAAVEATAEAIRARGEISRHAEHGHGAVVVKAEEYRRKRADAQEAIRAARAVEPGSFPPRPYRSPLTGRMPETGAGLIGTAAPTLTLHATKTPRQPRARVAPVPDPLSSLTGLTLHEQAVLNVLHAEPKGALTPTGDVKERAGIGHIAADRALLSLAEKGHIQLHRHDFPAGMSDAEKRRAVVHGGVHFIGAALRNR